jgi:general stress protein 26
MVLPFGPSEQSGDWSVLVGGVRLSRREAWRNIAAAHTGVLTSLRRDGGPVSLPVWFVALDRRLYVTGPARTKKVARIRQNSRVAFLVEFLVESGARWDELIGVHLTGAAAIVTEDPVIDRVARAFEQKYAAYRTLRDQMPTATRAHYESARATIEIIPDERILSWDNSRLFTANLS